MSRRKILQAVTGVLLCAFGFFLVRREPYEVRTVLATAGGCAMPTDVYEPRSGSPAGSVILFHGLSANKKVMSFAAQEFANQDLRVFVPDLPGHGKTPGPFSPARTEFCADALLRDLAARKAVLPERTLLAGHSMGGAIAARVSAHFPVAGVLAVSPAPMHPAASLAPELLLFQTPPILAPHSLVLSASLEPAAVREIAADLVAKSAASTNKYEIIPRTTHVSILFSAAAFEAIRSWTSQLLGTPSTAPLPRNMPALGCILGLIGLSVLAPPFLREMTTLPAANSSLDSNSAVPFVRTGIYLFLFSVAAVVMLSFFVPFRFLHIFQGGYFSSFLFIVGVAMLLVHRQAIPTFQSFFTSACAASFAASILLILLFGAWFEFTFYEAWLTPARWLRLPILMLVLLPWHLAEDLFLGSPSEAPRLRRIFQALAFRAILWLILVAAVFYLHSGQFSYLLLVFYFALFSILQRLAIDIIRAQTRSITAAAFFGAILLAGFTLAILPVA
jgi:pimeloyl-ACP methyl ester carboxylesterase